MENDRLLEELAGNAWPALDTRPIDGWLLRHTPGVASRRLNSLRTPLAGSTAAELSDIQAPLHAFYADRGVTRALIQVSPIERHAELDADLADRGYEREAAVDVLTAPIEVLTGLPARPERQIMVERVTPAWVRTLARLSGHLGRPALFEHVLSRITPPSACFAVSTNEGLAAVALAVTERGWLGLFCMVTAPQWRRRGYATALLGACGRWGVAQRCGDAYLQVEGANAPAQQLYRQTGFTRSHGYHYRVGPEQPLASS